MEPTRKRMRDCPHCHRTVTYSVYKKHKEEFYDKTSKQWTVAHRSAEENSWTRARLDAEDDLIISSAINSAGQREYKS